MRVSYPHLPILAPSPPSNAVIGARRRGHVPHRSTSPTDSDPARVLQLQPPTRRRPSSWSPRAHPFRRRARRSVLSARQPHSITACAKLRATAGASVRLLSLDALACGSTIPKRVWSTSHARVDSIALPAQSTSSGVPATPSRAHRAGRGPLASTSWLVAGRRGTSNPFSCGACPGRLRRAWVPFHNLFRLPTSVGALKKSAARHGGPSANYSAGLGSRGARTFVSVPPGEPPPLARGHDGFEDGTPRLRGIAAPRPAPGFRSCSAMVGMPRVLAALCARLTRVPASRSLRRCVNAKTVRRWCVLWPPARPLPPMPPKPPRRAAA